MALSLFDHHRRLHDLEAALGALLEILPSVGVAPEAIDAAAGRLRVRGRPGAAALLDQALRTYAR
jgi:hypothetical protein